MIALRQLPLVTKQVRRQRARSLLTIMGVAIAMFLFCGVQAMQHGAELATRATAADTTLIVYRQDRYCPATSRMPQSYEQRIAQIPGVASVVPMQIVVSNCRTSLDVVIFRGAPEEQFLATYGGKLRVVEGSLDEWRKRSDAALLGQTLARRRGLHVGDRFEAAGITVYVAGVVESDSPEHQNVAYVHLGFLQYATGSRSGGIVTQFNVQVDDPSQLEAVAAAIDATFAADQEPTVTRSEKAFVAAAASDVLEIVGFTRWLGLGALVAVLALVANAIVLAVQDRVREHAVLSTLGYSGSLIGRLILTEGILLSVTGGVIGGLLAFIVFSRMSYSLSVEGASIPIQFAPQTLVVGLGVAALVGVLAGLAPAIQAARRNIVESFRAI